MLRGPLGKIHSYAFLDSGSSITILEASVARRIGIAGPRIKLRISGITDRRGVECDCEKVNFEIISPSGLHRIANAITVEDLTLPKQTLFPTEITREPLAVKLGFRPYTDVRPMLLIGQDHCHLMDSLDTHYLRGGLLISLTQLGWVIHGSGKHRPQCSDTSVNSVTVTDETYQTNRGRDPKVTNEQLDSLVREYFIIDNMGISKEKNTDRETERVQRVLEDTTRRVGDRWETGLLWKSDEPLPESRKVAEQRLASLERRLDREPQYAEKYYREVKRFIELGYVSEAHGPGDSPRTWYLPHFCVIHPNRPNKARLVFDAASRSHGYCLNDYLANGSIPDQSVIGIMMRHREGKIAVKGDISDMFLRILMRPTDQDAQRFIWRGDRRVGKPVEFVVTRLMFGARPSPASAIYVRNRNAQEAAVTRPKAAASIMRNSYIDDYFESCDTVEDARVIAEDVMKINASGGFPMHDWASNDSRALRGIPNEARANRETRHEINSKYDGSEKALGMKWNTESDDLSFNCTLSKIPPRLLESSHRPTKREVLRVVMTVFDPLGLLAPFTVRAKILLREIWSSGIKWDETLKNVELVKWLRWITDLSYVDTVRLPRHYLRGRMDPYTIELHTFTDASSQAYTAVCYWRMDMGDETIETSLIASKCRVAPLKALTIPRLELQAAVLGAKLATCVTREHRIRPNRRIFWCDSRTVLCWIHDIAKQHPTFIANRVNAIVQTSSPSEWRWVPSSQNAADVATHEISIRRALGDDWFLGR